MKNKSLIIGTTILLAVFLCAGTAGALDFGLVIHQFLGYGNTDGNDSDAAVSYTGSYTPWITADLQNAVKLYASAKLSMSYESEEWKYGDPRILPELERTEVSWRPAPSIYLEAGRVRFNDPLGIIAAGLFDGAKGSFTVGAVRLTAGAFYTGLLYKETAKIKMSADDKKNYGESFDYTGSDYYDYFASRRVVLSAGAEFPVLTSRTTLVLNGLFQFDANDVDDAVHSQYLTAQFGVSPTDTLTVTAGIVAGLLEDQASDNPIANLAATLSADWSVPGSLNDMAQAQFLWSSGAINDGIGVFTPVSLIAQGQFFTSALSALMVVKGKYTARLISSLSASVEGSYFVRTDSKTVVGAGYPASDSRSLGGEIYCSVIWSPVSDMALTAGGGAFFPGDAFESDDYARWKVSAGIILSL
jgi:hypothetical protein